MRKTTWIEANFFRIDDTSKDYRVLEIDEPLTPSASITRTSVMGRHGQRVTKKGYKNKQVKISIGVFGKNSQEINDKVRALFLKIGFDTKIRLVIGDSPDKYYDAAIIDSCEEKIDDIYTVILVFECSFCKYKIYDDLRDIPVNQMTMYADSIGALVNKAHYQDITSYSSFTITNQGNFETKPLITITGSAQLLTIELGDCEMSIANVTTPIYVDCEAMNVYKIESTGKVSVLQNFSGKFPTIPTGDSLIHIGGTNYHVDVIVEFRSTYLV